MADDIQTRWYIAIMASSGFMIMAGAAVELNRRKRKKRMNTDVNAFKDYIRMKAYLPIF